MKYIDLVFLKDIIEKLIKLLNYSKIKIEERINKILFKIWMKCIKN